MSTFPSFTPIQNHRQNKILCILVFTFLDSRREDMFACRHKIRLHVTCSVTTNANEQRINFRLKNCVLCCTVRRISSRRRGAGLCLLTILCWFLAWLARRPWRGRQHILPEHWLVLLDHTSLIPEDRIIYTHLYENLKPNIIFYFSAFIFSVTFMVQTIYICVCKLYFINEWACIFSYKKELSGFSPHANYTDRVTAACRRS
jgi:hypothetical protein